MCAAGLTNSGGTIFRESAWDVFMTISARASRFSSRFLKALKVLLLFKDASKELDPGAISRASGLIYWNPSVPGLCCNSGRIARKR